MSAETTILILLLCLEGVSLIIHVLISIVYVITTIKKRVLHPNLQLLLILSPFPLIIFQIALYTSAFRTAVLPTNWKESSLILDIVMDTALFTGGLNIISLMAERVLATILVMKYEQIHRKLPLLALLLTSAQWLVAGGIMHCRYQDLIDNYIVFGSIGAAVVFALIVFLRLPRISKSVYDRALKREGRYGEILKRYVPLHVALAPIAIGGYFYIKSSSDSTSWIFQATSSLYHTYVSVMGIASCAAILRADVAFRSYLIEKFPKIFKRSSAVADSSVIPDTQGRNLNVTVEEQRSMYFNYYAANCTHMSDTPDQPSLAFVNFSIALRTIFSIIFSASTLLYYRVMLKRKVFHMNLFTILLFSPYSFLVILIPSIVKDVIQISTPLSDKQNALISMALDIGKKSDFSSRSQFSAGYNLLVLVSERAIATLYVTSYENMCSKFPWFALVLVTVQWTASIILLWLNYNGEQVSSVTLVISIGVGCVLATIVFALLPKISNRVYKRELSRQFGSVARYQAAENVRSAKVLRRLVLSTVGCVLLMLVIYSYIRFFVEKNFKLPWFNIHFTIVAICAVYLNFVVLFSHDALLDELLCVTRTNSLFGKKKKTDVLMVRSVNGNRLDVPKGQETSTYFKADLCDLFFFVTLYLYYKVLWNKKVFHSNLTVLLFIFPLAYVVALTPAIIRDIVQYFIIIDDRRAINRWFAISRWFDMVIDLGQYSASYNLLVLVAERAIATFYVSRYEYMCCKIPWLGCFLPLLQWAVCVPVVFINYYYYGRVIDLEPLLYSTAVSCVLAAIVFALLPRISEYVYKRQVDEKFGTVKRYQSIENLRSSTLLRRLVLLSVLFQLLCAGLYGMIILNTVTDRNTPDKLLVHLRNLRINLQNLYFAMLALIATLLNFVVVQSHPTLRKEFFRMTRLDKFRRQEKAPAINSVQGSRLDIPIADHSEFYFQSYRNSW